MDHDLALFRRLGASLDDLHGRVVEVKVKIGKHRPEESDDDEADRIHRLLLRKKRSGPLGLGD